MLCTTGYFYYMKLSSATSWILFRYLHVYMWIISWSVCFCVLMLIGGWPRLHRPRMQLFFQSANCITWHTAPKKMASLFVISSNSLKGKKEKQKCLWDTERETPPIFICNIKLSLPLPLKKKTSQFLHTSFSAYLSISLFPSLSQQPEPEPDPNLGPTLFQLQVRWTAVRASKTSALIRTNIWDTNLRCIENLGRCWNRHCVLISYAEKVASVVC